MNRDRTPSNILVSPLDLSGLDDDLTKTWREAKDEPDTQIKIGGRYGLVETAYGIFIFDQDGVGRGPLNADDTYEFDGYSHTEHSFGMFPVMTCKVSMDEAKSLVAGEPVPLEAFIRTFGARLEGNYYSMVDAINKANQGVTRCFGSGDTWSKQGACRKCGRTWKVDRRKRANKVVPYHEVEIEAKS